MKILVIIPVFNEEKNLEKCINSFINQTHKLSQITIVDDGSTDNTPLIGRKIEKSHSNIQFLKNFRLHDFSEVEDARGSADVLSPQPVNSTEDFREADQQSAAISQRTKFFVLSP